MSLPEVLPILTSERVTFEVRSHVPKSENPDDKPAETYDWFAVDKPGERLCAVVSALEYLDMRRVRALEDTAARNDKVIELARIETFFRGKLLGGPEKIPEQILYVLISKVVALSAVGSDPFVAARAESSP